MIDSDPINDTNHEKLIFSVFKQVFTQYNDCPIKEKTFEMLQLTTIISCIVTYSKMTTY